eukprot:TRINITY_DN1456_c0_g1_i4.p1 TRINITY_DN1456_c0_g1~~TRINITY_DN1456_c0_g1_i4.p1  ORF type:complete len:111 (-),score=6.35 TRINITY_DN1456_c0_g1_i4:135-467(-)
MVMLTRWLLPFNARDLVCLSHTPPKLVYQHPRPCLARSPALEILVRMWFLLHLVVGQSSSTHVTVLSLSSSITNLNSSSVCEEGCLRTGWGGERGGGTKGQKGYCLETPC